MDAFDNCILVIEEQIDALFNEAMKAADIYWDAVTAHEKQATGPEKRSNLELSCTKRGNNIQVLWKGIRWYGPANKRVRVRSTIERDKVSFSYKESQLKLYAKEWELNLVKETELIMQSIRRQNHHLVRAIMSIRNAKQVRRAADGKLEKLQAQAS